MMNPGKVTFYFWFAGVQISLFCANRIVVISHRVAAIGRYCAKRAAEY